ncbi:MULTISPECIES: hypothetical protein [unclassified Bradyrhizobium]|uniref:hypothetical protein n=1 Tax=Bradyrhizobium sp. USDA 4541 TaxID=2817704 RepID=UPI0020A283B9|nr:hypothetical protein [Bradyrhizobium sp. USDA 4541]MCP1852109.1 hypothetical protein [Bradyrhizobium sp. USDA 4541]
MSAVIWLKQRDACHLLVDATGYLEDGEIVWIGDKCEMLPDLHCAVSCLGAAGLGDVVIEALCETFSSFDEIVEGGPTVPGPVSELRGKPDIPLESLMREIFETYCSNVTGPGRRVCEAWLIGWSHQRNRAEGYSIWLENFDEWEKRDGGNPGSCPPFRLVSNSWPMNLACSPTPTKQQFDEAHFAPWDTESLIPEIDLLQFMELQRRKPFGDSYPPRYVVGGYALLTTVDRRGVTQRRIHTWPEDTVGGMITPLPIDWARWRAEREAPLQNTIIKMPPPLNRSQRRRLNATGGRK